jgi:hypothetical protein
VTGAPGPQLPATRATPERLVQLLVNIANRLERLEGLTDRLAEHVERVERRFDGEQIRLAEIGDRLSLALMLAGNAVSRREVWAGVACGIFAVILLFGIVGALLRHFPGLLNHLP